MPAGMLYPRIAGMGFVYYPLRVAGAGAGMGLDLRVRVCGVSIRADFTRCHLYSQAVACADFL